TADDLNFLMAVNSARIEQFKTARADVRSAQLRTLFRRMARESDEHLAQLRDLIRQLNGEVETGTTVSGDLHRVWIDVRSALSGHDTQAILAAVQCAEKATLGAYDRILGDYRDWPEGVFDQVERQRRTVEESRQTIQHLQAMPVPR
ncbi:MAG: PA2169 family four-helix-bundle protein, partial [Sphingobacteriaceae bacterium]|nr:PA2169 family four-helix-bundle protein [Cytophagaceae bacterium]